MENITTTTTTTTIVTITTITPAAPYAKKFELWLKAVGADRHTMEFCAARGFDPQTAFVDELSTPNAFGLAGGIELPTECGKIVLEMAKVVAHLAATPALKDLIDGALKDAQSYLDKQTGANCSKVWGLYWANGLKDAAVYAAWAAGNATINIEAYNINAVVKFAYKAAKGQPEVINKLDELKNMLSKSVYNCLIEKLEK